MVNKYFELVRAFNELDIEEKKVEIAKNLDELLKVLLYYNKSINEHNGVLPVYNNYNNEEEYLNLLFSYVISLKEENAKLVEFLNNKY